MADRPPITCHVLDTTAGLPAKNIPVTLSLIGTQSVGPIRSIEFSGLTNSDGRVTEWKGGEGDVLFLFQNSDCDMSWTLRFETGEYWSKKDIKPFFPVVQIAFVTTGFKNLGADESRPHWHVPLLLGPYNYTTYRGS